MSPPRQPTEKQIQASVIEHWQKLGVPGTLVAAIPNQFAHGQPGLTPGLADLLVIGPRIPGGRVGFIELKKNYRSPMSDAQKDFASLCRDAGISVVLAIGRDEPIAILERWGIVRRGA